MHQYLKKLVGDVSHTADLLGGAFQSQQTMETFVVVRKSVDAHHQSAAQSTASLGPADQPILKEPSLTLNAERPSFHSILKVLQDKNNREMSYQTTYTVKVYPTNFNNMHDICVDLESTSPLTQALLMWGRKRDLHSPLLA